MQVLNATSVSEVLVLLSCILRQPGCHMALAHLVTLFISSLRNLDIEANKFDDRTYT